MNTTTLTPLSSTGSVSMTQPSMDQHSANAAVSTRLRLTRRGRLVFSTLLTLLVAGVLAAAATLGSTQAAASDETAAADFGYVVVQPGESLWTVATALDPSADPRDTIAEIVRLNQLEGSDVQVGQPIAVPLRFTDAPGVHSASSLGIDV